MPMDDEQLETLLARYRPAGPAPALRQRVLEAAASADPRDAPAPLTLKLAWLAAAAVLVLCFTLSWKTASVESEIRTLVVGEQQASDRPPSALEIVFRGWVPHRQLPTSNRYEDPL